MKKITRIEVHKDKLVIHETREKEFIVFEGKVLEERFSWLGSEFTKVIPTFSGYGLAWNQVTKQWVGIDIREKKVNIIFGGKHNGLPSDLIQSFVVSEYEFGKWALEIPVVSKHGKEDPAYRIERKK